MPKQDTDVLEVLISQMAQYREIDPVLGEALRVLGHAELFEPVSNLLHRRASPPNGHYPTNGLTPSGIRPGYHHVNNTALLS